MKYQVTVTRTEYAVIDVEADSEEEAAEIGVIEATEEYDSQVWETTAIDTHVKESDEDEEEEEEELDPEDNHDPYFNRYRKD